MMALDDDSKLCVLCWGLPDTSSNQFCLTMIYVYIYSTCILLYNYKYGYYILLIPCLTNSDIVKLDD